MPYDRDPLLLEHVGEPSQYRLVITMAACMFLQMATFGMVEVLGVVYVELIDVFNAPRSVAALVQSVHSGLTLGGSILFSTLLTKYDSGHVIAVASLCAAITFCISCLAPNIEAVVVLIGVLTGLACSINVLASFVVVSWIFHNNRKLGLSIVTLGATLGQMTLPYLATVLIERYDWRGTVLIMGGMMYLNCIPCGMLVHFSKRYFHKGDSQKLKSSNIINFIDLKDIAFMVFLSTCFTAKLAGPVEQLFVVDMSVVKGFTTTMGASLLSLNGVCSFTGRCFSALILRKFPNTKQELHLIYWYIAWGISHVIISQSPVYWGMVLGIIIRGLSFGTVAAYEAGIQVELRGIEKFPQTLSIGNLLKCAGFIIGGSLGGLSFDKTHSYNFVFIVAAAVHVYNAFTMYVIYSIFKQRRNYQIIN